MKKNIYLKLGSLIGLLVCTSAWARDPVGWEVNPNPLPSSGFVGVLLNAKYTFTNNSPTETIQLLIDKDINDKDAFTIHDHCADKPLTPYQRCIVNVDLKSDSTGLKRAAFTMKYANNVVRVPAIWQVNIQAGTRITGEVSEELPNVTTVGKDYPSTFVFENKGDKAASQLKWTKNYPSSDEFKEGSNTCPKDGESLAANKSCEIQGTLSPKTEGNKTVSVSLSYPEGPAASVETSTKAVKVTVTGDIKPELPANTVKNETYPITFSFKNTSKQVATGVTIKPNYPKDFKEETNTCKADSLAAGKTCEITGDFTPTKEGQEKVGVTLSYAEGEPVPLETVTTVSEVAVKGEVMDELPTNMSVGETAPVKMTFTNTSASLPATNINITPNYPEGFEVEVNLCTEDKLEPKATCSIEGEFKPKDVGEFTIGTQLSYKEGSKVSLSTRTSVSKAEMSGRVSRELPSDAHVGGEYPVNFSFQNKSKAAAKRVMITPEYSKDFIEETNTCPAKGADLPAFKNCDITGLLKPQTLGEHGVAVNFAYQHGSPIRLDTKTHVQSLNVRGEVKQGLPAAMSKQARSEVTFAYSNTGDVPVTGVTIQKTYPKDFRETYTNCPKEGESLTAKTTCEIKGILTPRATGKEAVSVSFFAGGVSEVPLKTSTTVGKSLLVAVGGEGMLWTSQDGKLWKAVKGLPQKTIYTDVTWSPKLQQFLVTGTKGSILTSEDGSKWIKEHSNTTVELAKAIWSENLGQYLVVGEGGLVLTSYDGIEWDSAITNTTDYLTAAVWSQEQQQYVVVGDNGLILTSRDGYEWVTQSSNGVKALLRGIAWNPITKQYAVSTQSDYVLLSSDGIHWESIKVKPGNWRGITWGSRFMNTFAMVGEGSKIAVSQDGRQWVVGGPDPWGSNPMLYGISWDDGLRLFTAVGANGYLFTSPNGTSWSDSPEKVPCSACASLQGVGSGTVL